MSESKTNEAPPTGAGMPTPEGVAEGVVESRWPKAVEAAHITAAIRARDAAWATEAAALRGALAAADAAIATLASNRDSYSDALANVTVERDALRVERDEARVRAEALATLLYEVDALMTCSCALEEIVSGHTVDCWLPSLETRIKTALAGGTGPGVLLVDPPAQRESPAVTSSVAPAAADTGRLPWRVGSHYGIHVYEGERPVATFHTVVDARAAVAAYNATAGQSPSPTATAKQRTIPAIDVEAEDRNGPTMADFYRARAAELHTQDGHAACGGNCRVAQLLVMLDESRTIALEEGARASAAQATATTLRAALTALVAVEDSASIDVGALDTALARARAAIAGAQPQAPVAAPGGEG